MAEQKTLTQQFLPPNIATKTSKLMRGSDHEVVRYIHDKNEKWVDAHRDNRDRMFEALGAFYDINAGSWPKREREDLIAQGRHATSINIAHQKLQSLAGSLYSEKWDFEFLPLDYNETTLTKNIKFKYYADKDDYNYGHSERQTLEGGLINVAYERMEVDYSKRRTGGIAFKPTIPGTVLEDPYWQTNDLHDWREAIEHFWMTPQEILETFDTTDPYIKQAAMVNRMSGHDYEPTGDIEVYRYVPQTWGSKELVIQYRWLEKYKTTRLHGMMPDGEWIAFPLDVDEESAKNIMQFYQISPDDVKEFPYEDSCLYVAVVCPNLSPYAVLFNGKHDIQCGMIGLFPFSSYRTMGINKGVMEYLLDLQRTLNYRESKKDEIIASSAAGASAVDIDALPNKERDLEKIKQNKTRPDFVLGVHGDPNKIIARFPTGEVPNSIWQDMNVLVDMFDRVSPVTPALEGAATKDESGVLFEMRHAVTKLGTLMLYENWQQFLMNKAEAWYNQARIVYSNEYFKVKDDMGGLVEFNSPKYGTDGQKYYLNAVEDLPAARVVITLAKTSPTERLSKRMELFELTKMLSAHPELFKNQIRVLANDVMDTMDRIPEERVKLKQMAQLEEMRDILDVLSQIEQLKAAGLNAQVLQNQAQSMLQQMQAQMQQPQVPQAMSQGGPPPQQVSAAGGGQPPLPSQGGPTSSDQRPGAGVQTRRGTFQP